MESIDDRTDRIVEQLHGAQESPEQFDVNGVMQEAAEMITELMCERDSLNAQLSMMRGAVA